MNSKEKLTKNRMLITIIHDLDTTEGQLIFQLKIRIEFVRNLMFAFEYCVLTRFQGLNVKLGSKLELAEIKFLIYIVSNSTIICTC